MLPWLSVFLHGSIFVFDMRFVLRNECSRVSSEAQVIWDLGTTALSLHRGIYFSCLAFRIRKRQRDSGQAEDREQGKILPFLFHTSFACTAQETPKNM